MSDCDVVFNNAFFISNVPVIIRRQPKIYRNFNNFNVLFDITEHELSISSNVILQFLEFRKTLNICGFLDLGYLCSGDKMRIYLYGVNFVKDDPIRQITRIIVCQSLNFTGN